VLVVNYFETFLLALSNTIKKSFAQIGQRTIISKIPCYHLYSFIHH